MNSHSILLISKPLYHNPFFFQQSLKPQIKNYFKPAKNFKLEKIPFRFKFKGFDWMKIWGDI
jgi:hypothetical protein